MVRFCFCCSAEEDCVRSLVVTFVGRTRNQEWHGVNICSSLVFILIRTPPIRNWGSYIKIFWRRYHNKDVVLTRVAAPIMADVFGDVATFVSNSWY